jgi:hypothetical protein
VKGCGDTAAFHPIVLLTNSNGASLRLIVSLKICRTHRRTIHEVRAVLSDNSDDIVRGLETEAIKVVTRTLLWTAIDSAEAKTFARIQARSEATQ